MARGDKYENLTIMQRCCPTGGILLIALRRQQARIKDRRDELTMLGFETVITLPRCANARYLHDHLFETLTKQGLVIRVVTPRNVIKAAKAVEKAAAEAGEKDNAGAAVDDEAVEADHTAEQPKMKKKKKKNAEVAAVDDDGEVAGTSAEAQPEKKMEKKKKKKKNESRLICYRMSRGVDARRLAEATETMTLDENARGWVSTFINNVGRCKQTLMTSFMEKR